MRTVPYYMLNMTGWSQQYRFPVIKIYSLKNNYFIQVRKYHKEINAPKSTQEMRAKHIKVGTVAHCSITWIILQNSFVLFNFCHVSLEKKFMAGKFTYKGVTVKKTFEFRVPPCRNKKIDTIYFLQKKLHLNFFKSPIFKYQCRGSVDILVRIRIRASEKCI